MVTPSQLIPEFIQSLQKEIDALKKGKGGSIVKVFNGRLLREISGQFIYLFHLENFLAAIDDTPAEIEVAGKRYSCQIISVQGMEVQIALEKNLGQAIAEARIQTNLWFLLEMLRKKFEDSIPSAAEKFKTSERLFQGISTAISKKGLELRYTLLPAPPNPSQERAIAASFNKSLAVIWGPPGTGKTKTIAKAVEAHLNAGRRVLLTSHANTAVDEALEDITEQLEGTPYYKEGKLIRLGICHKTTLEEKYSLVILDNIAAMLGESLAKEKDRLLSERGDIDRFLDSCQDLIAAQSKAEQISKERAGLEKQLPYFSERLISVKSEISRIENNLNKRREKLASADYAGTLKRVFFGLDPRKIRREIEKLNADKSSKIQYVTETEQKYNETKANLSEKEAELKRLEQNLTGKLAGFNLTSEKLKSETQLKEKRRDAINSRLAEIDKALNEIQKRALAEARLVATTLTKTFTSKQFPDQPFDVLIVDESSMAPLPHIYWAASKVNSLVTIVGDFKQLPPICVSDDTIARKWLGRSIFDILNIASVQDACSDERVTLLDTQYRMAPKIAGVPNRLFYEGLLKNDPGTESLKMEEPISGRNPLVIVDTSGINPWCSRLSTGGRFNIYSALVSAEVARKLLGKMKDGRIGIVTPYRAQARLISKIAWDWGILEKVRVNTVHSFQGGEEKVIVLDCVEGPGVTGWSMLDDQKADSDARLLLNVALTRARYKVFLVAHKDYLCSTLKKESIILRVISIFGEEGREISSSDLIDNYLVTNFEKWASAAIGPERRFEPADSNLYTEKNFWPAFLSDLRSVQKKLVMMSPFVSLRRAGKMMDFFRALLGRDVLVCVYTRHPSEQSGSLSEHAEQVIKQLETLGAKVVQRKGMHQKIAIIDNRVAWEGSLNILSHKDTQEQMRRFEGENTVQEIVKNLELDKDEAVGNVSEKLCPECLKKGIDSRMVIRQGKFGTFWACPKYPACRHTENISRSRKR
ncbi:MAG: AAA domain-containing protein [Eubacteriales bacterium]